MPLGRLHRGMAEGTAEQERDLVDGDASRQKFGGNGVAEHLRGTARGIAFENLSSSRAPWKTPQHTG
jgi:hypothetical protein